MKFFTSTASALLMANAALASPLAAKLAARGGVLQIQKSGPGINMRNGTASKDPSSDLQDPTFDSQSSNWAGAIMSSDAGSVTEVQGSFTVPQPKVPSGGDSTKEYCGAAWVGIDGDTCQTSLIQTGIFWCIQNGATTYSAWYEYIPAASITYESGISIAAGDVISVKVTRNGDNGGVTTLENTSSGESGSHTFTDDTDGTLCGKDAEWIVEDFSSGGSLVSFADFDSVTFTSATAVVSGSTVSPDSDNATNMYLEIGSTRQTTSTFSGGKVTVNYVG
ncbi:Aspergillopepsin [Lachnellula occidentalis]|uniref:Aspergillopepsin n=1 Tax=Lachnellula occidentalis TaxID=215460 RepID=A0A8H8RQ79_9HELO|nr:Aspergillopepsin [Lachnellula occidentalis]